MGGTLGVSLSVAILGVLRELWVTHLSVVLYFLKVALALWIPQCHSRVFNTACTL